MECITWFVPILPGKLDEWKGLIEEIHGITAEMLQGPLPATLHFDFKAG